MAVIWIIIAIIIVITVMIVAVLLVKKFKNNIRHETFAKKFTNNYNVGSSAALTSPWKPPNPVAGTIFSTSTVNFYTSIQNYLPDLEQATWSTDISIYIPYMKKAGGCGPFDGSNPGRPYYFTWISKKYKMPIVSGYIMDCCANTCGPVPLPPGCATGSGKRKRGATTPAYKTRPKSKDFVKCGINGVTDSSYKYPGGAAKWFARGHMIPSDALNILSYDDAESTFSSCNMIPQTELQNSRNWYPLESAVKLFNQSKIFVVFQGPLISNIATWCWTPGNPPVIASCVPSASNNKITIPYAAWKLAVQLVNSVPVKSWGWIYDKDQVADNNTQPDPSISPYNNTNVPASMIFTPSQKYISPTANPTFFGTLQTVMGIQFSAAIQGVYQANCTGICSTFFLGTSENEQGEQEELFLDSETGNLVHENGTILYRPTVYDKENIFTDSNSWVSVKDSKQIKYSDINHNKPITVYEYI